MYPCTIIVAMYCVSKSRLAVLFGFKNARGKKTEDTEENTASSSRFHAHADVQKVTTHKKQQHAASGLPVEKEKVASRSTQVNVK